MYSVLLNKQATKHLDALPDAVARRVHIRLQQLRQDPRPTGCKKLKAKTDTYRIRVRDHCVVYDIDDTAHLVTILRINHRKDIYRNV